MSENISPGPKRHFLISKNQDVRKYLPGAYFHDFKQKHKKCLTVKTYLSGAAFLKKVIAIFWATYLASFELFYDEKNWDDISKKKERQLLKDISCVGISI